MIVVERSVGRSVEGRVSDTAEALDQLAAAAKPGEYSDQHDGRAALSQPKSLD